MSYWTKSCDIVYKLDDLYPLEDFTTRSNRFKIVWLSKNYKITLYPYKSTITIRSSKDTVTIPNTFYVQDSHGVDEWYLDVDKFVKKVSEIINTL
jgi:hypothetical protein